MKNLNHTIYLILIQSLILVSQSHSITLDNFTDLAPSSDYDENNNYIGSHIHSRFMSNSYNQYIPNSDTEPHEVRINRSIAEKFTITNRNLNFNAAEPYTPRPDYFGNSLHYTLEMPDDLTTNPSMKFNFATMSHDFNGTIKLHCGDGSDGTIDVQFNRQNLSPIVNLSSINNWTYQRGGLSNVHELDFTANTNNIANLTFNLTSIELVPEPFSTITLAGGIAQFVRKRKRITKNKLANHSLGTH